jgi:hypothetical protein
LPRSISRLQTPNACRPRKSQAETRSVNKPCCALRHDDWAPPPVCTPKETQAPEHFEREVFDKGRRGTRISPEQAVMHNPIGDAPCR